MPHVPPRASPKTAPLETRIRVVRGVSLLLDSDLAELYGVSTKALLQAVRRNPERFPSGFMVHLTNHEVSLLRSQLVTSNAKSMCVRWIGSRRGFLGASDRRGRRAGALLDLANSPDGVWQIFRPAARREIRGGVSEMWHQRALGVLSPTQAHANPSRSLGRVPGLCPSRRPASGCNRAMSRQRWLPAEVVGTPKESRRHFQMVDCDLKGRSEVARNCPKTMAFRLALRTARADATAVAWTSTSSGRRFGEREYVIDVCTSLAYLFP